MSRFASTAIAAALLSSHALAAEQTVREVVPASACEPLGDHDKVELVEGSWRFQGDEIGLVAFHCPIRASNFFVSPTQTTFENQTQALFIDFYDPDSFGSTHWVQGQLRRTGEAWTAAEDVGFAIGDAALYGDNTDDRCLETYACAINFHVIADAKYFVRVDMFRGSPNDGPRLVAVGLDFSAPI